MILKHSLWLLSAVLILSGCGNQKTRDEGVVQNIASSSENEWKPLFDGTTTNGWRSADKEAFPTEGWEIRDSMLMSNGEEGKDGKGGDIMTNEEYGDFILEWEWKMLTKGGNSGVKYFVKDEASDDDTYGPGLEYQILDDDNHPWMLEGKMKPGDFHTMASLYELYPAGNKSPTPLGEWNHSRIVAQGKHVEHWLNGAKVLEYERGSDDFKKKAAESKFAGYKNYGEADRGHILLQDHGSKMAFRNIKIKAFD